MCRYGFTETGVWIQVCRVIWGARMWCVTMEISSQTNCLYVCCIRPVKSWTGVPLSRGQRLCRAAAASAGNHRCVFPSVVALATLACLCPSQFQDVVPALPVCSAERLHGPACGLQVRQPGGGKAAAAETRPPRHTWQGTHTHPPTLP